VLKHCIGKLDYVGMSCVQVEYGKGSKAACNTGMDFDAVVCCIFAGWD
jgi:hypothetical protein